MRLPSALTLLVTAGVTIGCTGDNLSAPTTREARPAADTTAPRNTLLPGPTTIIPLQRTSPLTSAEQRSATIGLLGGSIRLPGAGLTVIIPPLALTSATTISATALAGSNVAYELSPHGLSFLVPVIAIQDLRPTAAARGGLIDPLLLFVGYFPNSASLTSVTELLSLNVNVLGQTSTALLWHFSGYVWSSGRASEESEGQ